MSVAAGSEQHDVSNSTSNARSHPPERAPISRRRVLDAHTARCHRARRGPGHIAEHGRSRPCDRSGHAWPSRRYRPSALTARATQAWHRHGSQPKQARWLLGGRSGDPMAGGQPHVDIVEDCIVGVAQFHGRIASHELDNAMRQRKRGSACHAPARCTWWHRHCHSANSRCCE